MENALESLGLGKVWGYVRAWSGLIQDKQPSSRQRGNGLFESGVTLRETPHPQPLSPIRGEGSDDRGDAPVAWEGLPTCALVQDAVLHQRSAEGFVFLGL